MIDSHPPKRRQPEPHEAEDQEVGEGDFVGTTGELGGMIWRFEGGRISRVGVPDPDYRSMVDLEEGETVRSALARIPMFATTTFVIHRMQLPPGGYYRRMARPHDQHWSDPLGFLPGDWLSPNAMIATLNQVRSLVGMLNEVFQIIHPVEANMSCYGSSTRNLLILACTECEAQWRSVLAENEMRPERPATNDYVRLRAAMRLDEYAVKLQHYPWLPPVAPFEEWESKAPTASLSWYADYNAAKHDRENSFERASVSSAVQAVSALWIMVAAQYGHSGVREFDDLHRYFHLERVPLWRFSEVYPIAYPGFDQEAGPRPFPW